MTTTAHEDETLERIVDARRKVKFINFLFLFISREINTARPKQYDANAVRCEIFCYVTTTVHAVGN